MGTTLLDKLEDMVNELESVVRDIAIDITTGTLVERLTPDQIWQLIGGRIRRIHALLSEIKEQLSIIKPEKKSTITRSIHLIGEKLRILKETLDDKSATPIESSRIALEELRQIVISISDFVKLCREIKIEPSPLISSILSMKGEKIIVPNEAWRRVEKLRELIKEAQETYVDAATLTTRLENRLEAVRQELENLYESLTPEKE